MSRVLSVLHERKAGWHTFTSLQVPGLFLTGPEPELDSLREALPSTINALIEANGGEPLSIEALESLSLFAAEESASEMLHFSASAISSAKAPAASW